VSLDGFFVGPGTTVLGPGDLMVEVQVPLPAPRTKGIYLKYATRGTIDLAVVGVAVVIAFEADGLTCRDVRIALGAVAPTPVRARSAESILKGKKLEKGLIDRSSRAAVGETRCISDVRASAEYRREMVQVFTRRALKGLMG